MVIDYWSLNCNLSFMYDKFTILPYTNLWFCCAEFPGGQDSEGITGRPAQLTWSCRLQEKPVWSWRSLESESHKGSNLQGKKTPTTSLLSLKSPSERFKNARLCQFSAVKCRFTEHQMRQKWDKLAWSKTIF